MTLNWVGHSAFIFLFHYASANIVVRDIVLRLFVSLCVCLSLSVCMCVSVHPYC